VRLQWERNQLKDTIAQNFANNPKENPMVVTTSLVLVFIQLLKWSKRQESKNVAAIMALILFIKEYDVALKNYPMKG
jgi:DNA polymerase-3 subunit delta